MSGVFSLSLSSGTCPIPLKGIFPSFYIGLFEKTIGLLSMVYMPKVKETKTLGNRILTYLGYTGAFGYAQCTQIRHYRDYWAVSGFYKTKFGHLFENQQTKCQQTANQLGWFGGIFI